MNYRLAIRRFPGVDWSFETPVHLYPGLPVRSLADNMLVAGVDSLLDHYEARYGIFDLVLSDTGYVEDGLDRVRLSWISGDLDGSQGTGNWYKTDGGDRGWLCAVLHDYFPVAPAFLFLTLVTPSAGSGAPQRR